MEKNGSSAVRCAAFCHEDGCRRLEVRLHRSRSRTSGAVKTVVMAIKSLFMAERGYFSFEIFGAEETFVCYRRFSGSSVFPHGQDFLLFCNKKRFFFDVLPCPLNRLFPNPILEKKNVRPELFRISGEIEKHAKRGLL